MSWIDEQFPSSAGKHSPTSLPTDVYNCIAFAAGDETDWWSHVAGYKWPAHRSPLINALVAVFAALGYEERPKTDTTLEPQYEKVAIYAKRGFWKHAARQKPSGKWTSKLGVDDDIEHDDPECLCGDWYGEVHCIMRRPRNDRQEAQPTEPGK